MKGADRREPGQGAHALADFDDGRCGEVRPTTRGACRSGQPLCSPKEEKGGKLNGLTHPTHLSLALLSWILQPLPAAYAEPRSGCCSQTRLMGSSPWLLLGPPPGRGHHTGKKIDRRRLNIPFTGVDMVDDLDGGGLMPSSICTTEDPNILPLCTRTWPQ